MAFIQVKLTKSINQSRGIFDKYIYKPDNGDLIADILGSGYFDDSRYIGDPDWFGSIIEISASNGYAVGRIVVGGLVVLYDSTGGGSINVEWGAITGDINSQADLAAVAKTNNYGDLNNVPALRPVGDVIYLHTDGSDSNIGLTPELPVQTMGAAITKAIAMSPGANNQIIIESTDGGTYTGDVDVPSFVHVMCHRAAWNGKMRIADSCLIHFRSAQNSNPSDRIFKKDVGMGEASIILEALFVVGSGQEGVICDAGRVLFRANFASVDAGHAMKAKNGSEIVFNIAEVNLLNGGIAIGTKDTDGAGNFYSGSILNGVDDGTGIMIETRVDGDEVNLFAGHIHVDTLYDLGLNSTLSCFVVSAGAGATTIKDSTATVNITLAGGASQTIARSFDTQTLLIHNGTEATESVIDFGSTLSRDFDIVNGVVEILTDMTQVEVTIEIHLIKSGAQDAEFDCWLEASGDSGVTWVAIADSLRREVVVQNGSSNVIADFSFNVPLPIGGLFRIVATNNGANTLSMEKPDDIVTANGGATGFAKKVNLVKIK